MQRSPGTINRRRERFIDLQHGFKSTLIDEITGEEATPTAVKLRTPAIKLMIEFIKHNRVVFKSKGPIWQDDR